MYDAVVEIGASAVLYMYSRPMLPFAIVNPRSRSSVICVSRSDRAGHSGVGRAAVRCLIPDKAIDTQVD